LKEALQKILELSAHGNKYFQNNKPWEIVNTDRKRCGTVLYICANLCRALSILLYPYLPGSCIKLWNQLNLGVKPEGNVWDSASNLEIDSNHKIKKPEILFKKIEEEEAEEIKDAIQKKLEGKNMLSFSDFKKMEIKVGTVKEAEAVEGSKKLVKMQVDFGDFERQVVAGILNHYKPEELVGKQWIFVTNLEHAKLMGIESQAMILAAVEGKENKVVCLKPDKEVKNGTPVQ
jgi:methionyl-tRNA synthetase